MNSWVDLEAEVEAARSGDTDAFTRLYDRYVRLAFRVAIDILHDASEAEDAVQEAFLDAHRNLHQLRDPSLFRQWMMQIVVRKCSRRRKRRARDLEAREKLRAELQRTSNEQEVDAPVRRLFDAFLEELSDADRSAFSMAVLHHLAYEEIANTLGVTEDSVRARLYRVRQRFREFWKKYHDELQ
jgi:RNA polymerase sigma-70 factor (ECF subfamily)